ncbi:CvpA family protein [Caldimonas sp. KR1-144]|uniref:CvpA family protein n=1 Tax=Caldimonas sp. KR1-144 TaxID=3400911 RepID=UPI003C0C4CBB
MDTIHIGWVDIALALIVGVSVIVGLWRGLTREVFSLIGWVVAYVAAQALGPMVAAHLRVGEPGSALNIGAAFVLVFLVALVAWSLVTWLISRLVQASVLNALDRTLGAVFGLARGVLIALVIVTIVSLTPWATSPTWRASHGASSLQYVLSGLKPLLPADLTQHLRLGFAADQADVKG